MKLIVLLITVFVSASVFAGGKGPSSIIPSWVNFGILVVGLVVALKGKASSFFTSKSDSVVEMMDRAESKAKEAQYMMDVQKKKFSGVEDEIKSMKDDQEKILKEFEDNYKADVEQRVAKLKEDANQKIEAEKAELVNDLNADLLNLVVANAKSKLKGNPALSEVATSNIIKGL